MRVFRYELKKLLICPFLLGLLAVFAAFDIFALVNDLSSGYIDYKGIYQAVVGDDAADVGAIDYYKNFCQDFSAIYDTLDMNVIFRQKMSLYYPSTPEDSPYFKWAENNYQRLQKRVETIRSTDEGSGDFYPGPAYKIHKKLCGLLSRSLLESMIFAAMSVLYLMDYERLNGAEGVIYPTKSGRKIQLIKILAGAVFSLIAAALLFMIPIAVFSAVVPMKGLWGTAISSFALTEPSTFFSYPFITRVKMSVFGQLFASLGLCAVVILITLLTCAGMYFIVRNSYWIMLGAGVAFLGMMLLPYAFPTGFLHTLPMMSPAVLWDSVGMWFIEFDPARGRFFEIATALLWAAISSAVSAVGWRRFNRTGI